jgi:BTB/POZ domain-containing protein KCTD9
VKTLYEAKLDEDLLVPLKEKYPALFDEPKE